MSSQISQTLLYKDKSYSVLSSIIITLFGSLLFTLAAKTQVFTFLPVKISLQTITIIAFSALVGKRLAFLTCGLYLLEGALGLPVFQSTPERGIGLIYMMGPTGGYLLGFWVAAWITGMLAAQNWGKSIYSSFAVFVIGEFIIAFFGTIWLAYLFGFAKAMVIAQSLIYVTILKIGVGTIMLPNLLSLKAYFWKKG